MHLGNCGVRPDQNLRIILHQLCKLITLDGLCKDAIRYGN